MKKLLYIISIALTIFFPSVELAAQSTLEEDLDAIYGNSTFYGGGEVLCGSPSGVGYSSMFFLGDSIGVGLRDYANFQDRIGELYPVTMDVLGGRQLNNRTSGIEDGQRALDRALGTGGAAVSADIIVIELGTNDYLKSADDFLNDIELTLSRIREVNPTAEIIWFDTPSSSQPAGFSKINSVIYNNGSRLNYTVYSMFGVVNQGPDLNATAITSPINSQYVSSDNIHPTAEGSRLIVDDFFQYMQTQYPPGSGDFSINWPVDLDPLWIETWEQMGAEYNIDPKLLGAIFTAEHGGNFYPTTGDGGSAANGGWRQPSSSTATGPFQILDGTWDGLRRSEPLLPARTDRGPTDPRNDYVHASRGAAVYISQVGGVPGLPAGSGDQPQGFKPNRSEVPYTAASVGIRYNQGGAWHDGMSVQGNNFPFEYAQQTADTYTLLGGQDATGPGGCDTATNFNGNFLGTIEAYAWSDYRGRGYITPKPEYEAATAEAVRVGEYVGYNGIDCGGFVTRTMRNSGLDPNYNTNAYGDIGGWGARGGGNTPIQTRYLTNPNSGWEEIPVSSTADLQPGDVAMDTDNPSHTFMWIGSELNFETEIASASGSTNPGVSRAPMSGRENPMDGRWHWYRKVR